jgi:hypothetical protein
VSDAERERIAVCLERLHAAYDPTPVAIDVTQTPRAHTGLGSGTQLALAVGVAFVRLLGHVAPSAELAALLGRGARSGIGVLGFDSGGLLVDGGPSGDLHPGVPPLLARQPFPDDWRVLLVSDNSREGLHGADERRGLAALAPFPQKLAAHLCHLVLMKILPGAAERNIVPFAHGLTEMQQTIGEYFAPVQAPHRRNRPDFVGADGLCDRRQRPGRRRRARYSARSHARDAAHRMHDRDGTQSRRDGALRRSAAASAHRRRMMCVYSAPRVTDRAAGERARRKGSRSNARSVNGQLAKASRMHIWRRRPMRQARHTRHRSDSYSPRPRAATP